MMSQVLEAVGAGEFTRDAFAAVGVGWSTAHGWLRLGEASAKLAAEPGSTHALTWQGQLYLDVKQAEALAVSAPIRKLRAQAATEGGELAVKFVKLRRGRGGGGAGGPAVGLGTDYVEQEVAAGQDQMTDDDVLRLFEEAIAAAEAAVSAGAGAGEKPA